MFKNYNLLLLPKDQRIGKDSWQIIQQFIIHFTSYHKNIAFKSNFPSKTKFLVKIF